MKLNDLRYLQIFQSDRFLHPPVIFRAIGHSFKMFSIGFISCLLLFGCAGFTYRYYGLAGAQYDKGMLLGPKESDDIPFTACQSSQDVKHPCVVMLSREFYALKLDYQDTKNKLEECEKRKN